jgi:hypothetical protein
MMHLFDANNFLLSCQDNVCYADLFLLDDSPLLINPSEDLIRLPIVSLLLVASSFQA